MSINNKTNFYDVGYRLIRKYWNKGYATEAARAAVDYGFNMLKLEEIYGMADSGNLASRSVLEKAGLKYLETFVYDDVPHDWFRMFMPYHRPERPHSCLGF